MRHIISYRAPRREDIDIWLRNAVPGNDGSGMGFGQRDVEFTNDWTHEQVEEKARAICGELLIGVYTDADDVTRHVASNEALEGQVE